MQDYKVILTWEAIYDVADIADYIEMNFGINRADRFQNDIETELNSLSYMGNVLPKTYLLYRKYVIYKKLFSPSIIFYIVKEKQKEVHVLRILRESRDWEKILSRQQEYTYPEE